MHTVDTRQDDLNRDRLHRIIDGMVSGFVGSLVLAILIVVKTSITPDYDLIAIRTGIFGNMIASPALGWFVHFITGTFIWGTFYAACNRGFGDDAVIKGTMFGILTWFIALLVLMPLTGTGILANNYGSEALSMSFVLQLIFSLVVALTYDKMKRI